MIFSQPSREASIRQIEGLQGKIKEILTRALRERKPSSEIADAMARERINSEGKC
ncbi:hypothetical protein [Paracoccus seriniphilus]|uniref:hypothetical protein n=1 Tax=Paracoccus seriniphilus TaxID=184748 RepID=UPI0023500475|nr:hypothetical protein [Paracoccus seriniphilus]WCR13052.1 hypothetical protein JHW44_08820 [Paracoccus seriniphilus]